MQVTLLTTFAVTEDPAIEAAASPAPEWFRREASPAPERRHQGEK